MEWSGREETVPSSIVGLQKCCTRGLLVGVGESWEGKRGNKVDFCQLGKGKEEEADDENPFQREREKRRRKMRSGGGPAVPACVMVGNNSFLPPPTSPSFPPCKQESNFVGKCVCSTRIAGEEEKSE